MTICGLFCHKMQQDSEVSTEKRALKAAPGAWEAQNKSGAGQKTLARA
jgi:hypothetical protein